MKKGKLSLFHKKKISRLCECLHVEILKLPNVNVKENKL